MSGVAGRIGVKHSLLRVSVGDGSSGHAYVIEKAAPPTDVEQFQPVLTTIVLVVLFVNQLGEASVLQYALPNGP